MTDNTQQLIDQVKSAHTNNTTLKIVGGNSKAFLQACNAPDTLEMTSHAGVVNYEPTELVLTARAGTPIVEIEKLLTDNGQYLSFEPLTSVKTQQLVAPLLAAWEVLVALGVAPLVTYF